MNRWRIAGLLLIAAFAAWLALRSCAPTQEVQPPTSSLTPPQRDQFHASRPLQVVASQSAASLPWLERELRYLLIRGRMQVAAIGPGARPVYTLRVELDPSPATTATLRLQTPEGEVEREQVLQTGASALAVMQALATQLPAFLDAAHTQGNWAELVGTDDPAAYDSFLKSSEELLGPDGHGFTQPVAAENSASVNRLEALTRKHPRFARAWSLLAVSYLGLGGKDELSLTHLAETSAEHALALDPALTNAQSALGLVRLRRGEWVAALEHFRTTLKTDPNASAALEGLACLLMDVGQSSAALPIAQRAVALQPVSIGANECLAYAQLATGTDRSAPTQSEPLDVAVVLALDALLSGQTETAQRTLKTARGTKNGSAWIDPLIRAASNRAETPKALRAITRAANDNLIDPVAEVVCGAALQQSDFVFNRMLRLSKQDAMVPLRILWLPKTQFLRQHAGFEDIVSAEGLLPYWQDHGLPDICSSEPAIYGCRIKPQKIRKEE